MYQFSLEFYVKTFRKSIKSAEKTKKKDQRILNLQDSLKKAIYF